MGHQLHKAEKGSASRCALDLGRWSKNDATWQRPQTAPLYTLRQPASSHGRAVLDVFRGEFAWSDAGSSD